MKRKLTRRMVIRGFHARTYLPLFLVALLAACGTDSITNGGDDGGDGGGGTNPPLSGRTFPVAGSVAAIGDVVVDAVRGVLYVSNKQNNSVDMISWTGDALERTGRALVGSAPWGMTLDLTRDTLIVANSGGTSISYVDLTSFAEARRFYAPNAVLWQFTPEEDGKVILTHFDFSDRPQHIAQDASGVVLYSTQPTSAAPDGSIRMVQWDAAWAERESDLLLWTQVVDDNAWGPGMATPGTCHHPVTLVNLDSTDDPGCVIAFADSVRIHYENPTLGTQWRVYDHVPGNPDQVISVTSGSWYEIYTGLRAQGSDIFMYLGEWKLDEWLNADTTFVTASGDGSSIAIAEGARNPGRVWLWGEMGAHPPLFDRWISDVVNISDYANNTSSEITGMSVNHTGDVMVTRGASSVFFLTQPAQLRGTYSAADISGGAGVAVHPLASFDGGSVETNWAAVGGGGSDIILIDTRHFRRIGRIIVPQRVAGPLRIVDRRAADDADVRAHLFGVTASGHVFHVPVLDTDINP
ncbi:MAG TPA: hypothetical protein VK912_02835 [Longimicrobiales bacterium]|nr:hypothetical protein [Longimicrobiales bacterium]